MKGMILVQGSCPSGPSSFFYEVVVVHFTLGDSTSVWMFTEFVLQGPRRRRMSQPHWTSGKLVYFVLHHSSWTLHYYLLLTTVPDNLALHHWNNDIISYPDAQHR